MKLVAADGVVTEEERIGLLSIAIRSGESLAEMINDLLDVHKLQEGGVRLERASHSVRDVARGAVDKVQALAKDQGITVTLASSEPPPQASIDVLKIERVLVNLLGNALKFSPPRGAVSVRIAATEGSVRVEVQDQGIGIAAHDAERIFERFYQVRRRQPQRGLDGPRADVLQARRRGPRRHHLGRQRREQRQHVRLHAAALNAARRHSVADGARLGADRRVSTHAAFGEITRRQIVGALNVIRLTLVVASHNEGKNE
jgi:anti-sigma regulatory factor (Ser/Thr protein kinase)